MQSLSITKYGFRIRTRNGAIVENLSIFGQDESEAQRKLRQIYNDCEILESHSIQKTSVTGRNGHVCYEDVMDLLTTNGNPAKAA